MDRQPTYCLALALALLPSASGCDYPVEMTDADGGVSDAGPPDGTVDAKSEDAPSEAACPKNCRGTACLGGFCEVVRLFQPSALIHQAFDVSLGDGHLLWADVGKNVHRMSSDGGPSSLIVSENDYPAGLRFSTGTFFWTRRYGGEIRSAEPPQFAVTTLATVSGGPYSLAAVDGDADVFVATREGGEVLRVPRSGGTPEVMASGQTNLRFIAADAEWLVWTLSPTGEPQGGVRKLERKTGAVSVIADDLPGPLAITVAGGYAYWANTKTVTGSIMRAALSGGPPQAIASMAGAAFVASDATRVYWTSESAVWSVAVDGGTPEPLALNQPAPRAIAVDDLWVYWVSLTTGEIFRVAK